MALETEAVSQGAADTSCSPQLASTLCSSWVMKVSLCFSPSMAGAVFTSGSNGSTRLWTSCPAATRRRSNRISNDFCKLVAFCRKLGSGLVTVAASL